MKKLGYAAKRSCRVSWRWLARFWGRRWWHKLVIVLIALIVACFGTMYSIAQWYIHSEQHKPLQMGVSFIPDYAASLGLDPHQTLTALTGDLQVRNFRLVSYWSDIETQQGTYNFGELDWEMQQVAAVHGTVTLSIGLRQPRWPECHMPAWAAHEATTAWEGRLNNFISAVVNRYKSSPILISYQLENEYFLQGFGACTNFDRSRLISEFNLVKRLDPSHPIILSRGDNFPDWLLGQPQPDIVGMSVYRRVWDGTFTHRYFNYPTPSWYYAFLAGVQKILTGKESVIHEMQAEACPPNGQSIADTSLAEQNKTLDAHRLQSEINFAQATGMRQVYLWGAEYWYYRMVTLHDPSVWNTAKQTFRSNS
ncbi:MAG TPA: hypothetical protein VKQ34_02870 [Candidatus Saccharimonadales bacterium]|nr:hypothetical protein [Candidatus Saccharimonadales bacterium]